MEVGGRFGRRASDREQSTHSRSKRPDVPSEQVLIKDIYSFASRISRAFSNHDGEMQCGKRIRPSRQRTAASDKNPVCGCIKYTARSSLSVYRHPKRHETAVEMHDHEVWKEGSETIFIKTLVPEYNS